MERSLRSLCAQRRSADFESGSGDSKSWCHFDVEVRYDLSEEFGDDCCMQMLTWTS